MRPRVGFGPAPAESAVSAVVAPLDDGFTGWHATSVKELEADKEPKQARSATEGDACLSHLHVFTGHTDLGGGVGMRRYKLLSVWCPLGTLLSPVPRDSLSHMSFFPRLCHAGSLSAPRSFVARFVAASHCTFYLCTILARDPGGPYEA